MAKARGMSADQVNQLVASVHRRPRSRTAWRTTGQRAPVESGSRSAFCETRRETIGSVTSELRRKTPEELLLECQAEEAAAKKGHLKIFLGYASGVGKSFRMLDEARRRRERGQDVVVGAIQPRVPPEVEALLKNLEVIPLKQVDNGTAIDVETLIRRHPVVCFVDGLAYNNPPGLRNPTRWQDVQDLLDAGIKVIASINVQYVAELQKDVEAITGKHVTETVPISFIESADEIEIVDTPPEEPMERSARRAGTGSRARTAFVKTAGTGAGAGGGRRGSSAQRVSGMPRDPAAVRSARTNPGLHHAASEHAGDDGNGANRGAQIPR